MATAVFEPFLHFLIVRFPPSQPLLHRQSIFAIYFFLGSNFWTFAYRTIANQQFFHQPTMPFDFVQQVRSRNRSVQLDQTALAAAGVDTGSSQPPQATKRITSLPASSQRLGSSPPPASAPNTVPQYRSMLDVDEPPKLGPWTSLPFDALFSGSMDSSKFDSASVSSSLTEIATPASADAFKPGVADLIC